MSDKEFKFLPTKLSVIGPSNQSECYAFNDSPTFVFSREKPLKVYFAVLKGTDFATIITSEKYEELKKYDVGIFGETNLRVDENGYVYDVTDCNLQGCCSVIIGGNVTSQPSH